MLMEKTPKIFLNKKESERLSIFSAMIFDASKKFNLTGLKSREAIHEILVMESVMAFNFYRPIKNKFWSKKIVDIGAGAGIPSIPLKILNNNIKLTLIESNAKKSNFIEFVSNQLDLDVKIINDRAESIGQDQQFRETFDIALTRGLGRLPTVAEITLPLLKVKGTALSIKGINISKEILKSENAVTLNGGELIGYLRATKDSSIVAWRKISKTKSKYPRKVGTPQKNPLK